MTLKHSLSSLWPRRLLLLFTFYLRFHAGYFWAFLFARIFVENHTMFTIEFVFSVHNLGDPLLLLNILEIGYAFWCNLNKCMNIIFKGYFKQYNTRGTKNISDSHSRLYYVTITSLVFFIQESFLSSINCKPVLCKWRM